VKKWKPRTKYAVLPVRRDDHVTVIAGDHKGKEGRVLKVFPETQRVIVEGVNMVKRHTRAGRERQGGIVEKEAPIHVSNVKKTG
jgi:large subunit ribosomal protein L24